MEGTIAADVTVALFLKIMFASRYHTEHIGSLSTTTLFMVAWNDCSNPYSTPRSFNQLGWSKILTKLATTASELNEVKEKRWCIEAHQFRIDTTDGIGRPTPEGAHRDGVDWVAVFLVNRNGVKGGETRVFEADGPHGERFTLSEPWSLLLLNDARMIHESTPIQPLAESGYRDTLVVTLRENYFQNPVSSISKSS